MWYLILIGCTALNLYTVWLSRRRLSFVREVMQHLRAANDLLHRCHNNLETNGCDSNLTTDIRRYFASLHSMTAEQ